MAKDQSGSKKFDDAKADIESESERKVPSGVALGDGVLDPVEPGHPTPEGLERERKGPLNKRSGRRSPDAE